MSESSYISHQTTRGKIEGVDRARAHAGYSGPEPLGQYIEVNEFASSPALVICLPGIQNLKNAGSAAYTKFWKKGIFCKMSVVSSSLAKKSKKL